LLREEHESRREIDNFRRVMHERFYAFDPLTMDETVLKTAKRQGEVKVVEAGSRWLLPEDV
jgi:adenylate kinase